MRLEVEPYLAQKARWPSAGRHILAQYDAESIVVYQAFRPETGEYAAAHGRFGPGFSVDRMSWIKTNFLWMMYRSGWGTKPGQEVTLAIWLARPAFDQILALAVPSSLAASVFDSEGEWRAALRQSTVRLQWDPDHHPNGASLTRRAVQLGLRGDTLRRYAQEWILQIQNVSAFVAEQREALLADGVGALITPREEEYAVSDPSVARHIGLEEAAQT